MKHRVGYNRLGRKPSHRKSLHRNLVTSLFKYERITTTKAKAREIRRTAEKMITRAKIDSVHNRRIVAKDLQDKGILAKLFVEIAPRYVERPGGYTRMLKIGRRQGDAAEMVLLELVGEEMPEPKKAKSESKPKAKKKADKPKAEKKAKEAAAEDNAEAVETEVADEPADDSAASEEADAEPAEETSADDTDAADDSPADEEK